jgi:hypothetical protein
MIPPEHVRRRIRWLVAVHLCLAASPLLWPLIPLERFLPALWAVYAVPIGGMLMLAFWVGLGTSRLAWRSAVGLAGSAYLALWPTAAAIVLGARQEPDMPLKWMEAYMTAAALYSIVVAVFGGMFLLMRCRWTLTRMELPTMPTQADRLRFSVLNLLVVTSLVAVVLMLVQSSRGDVSASSVSGPTWQSVATYALGFVIFSTNTLCAAQAALGKGSVPRNVLLVLLVAMFSGLALSLAAHQDQVGWLFVAGGTLIVVIPMLIVVVSLSVVRSCGFRLIPKPSLTEGR